MEIEEVGTCCCVSIRAINTDGDKFMFSLLDKAVCKDERLEEGSAS